MSPDIAYCKALPKVELHAHLSGSITRSCLEKIWQKRREEDQDLDIEDPRIALADETVGQSIDVFFAQFNTYLYHLLSTPSALVTATRAVLAEFADDGVVYLELRTTPRALPASKVSPELSAEESIRLIVSVIAEWNKRESERMKVNLILTVDRAKHSETQAMEIVILAKTLRDEGLPVVGVDLAGDPQVPSDLTRFRKAFAYANSHNLGITLHFAEVPASSTPEELEELLSWNPKRLGHVIHVPEDLRKEIVKRRIAPELCLTCNILAGMLPVPEDKESAEIVDHHFGWWYTESGNGSLSLGTDDVGVFGSPSSSEYHLAAKHFGLSKVDLVNISRRAVEGIFGSADDKRRDLELIEAFEAKQNQVDLCNA